jgi:hypothetical protein
MKLQFIDKLDLELTISLYVYIYIYKSYFAIVKDEFLWDVKNFLKFHLSHMQLSTRALV